MSKDNFQQMRSQGFDVDDSGNFYQEPQHLKKCKAYNIGYGADGSECDCDEIECIKTGQCKFKE